VQKYDKFLQTEKELKKFFFNWPFFSPKTFHSTKKQLKCSEKRKKHYLCFPKKSLKN